MKRALWVLVVVALLAGAGFGVSLYRRPVWTQLQMTHLKFFLHRVHSEYVATPEGRVHFYEAEPTSTGGGTPLVLVHGLGDRSEAWAAMIVPLRQAGFHVYALDLLGYGRSPKPADSVYSIAAQEKLVADYIQAMGLQKPEVVGWSMGGWITLKLALDHPEMLDRVVVFNAAGVQYPRDYPVTVFHPTDAAELNRLATLLEPNRPPLPGWVVQDALRKFAAQQWVIDRGIASMATAKDALDDSLPKMQVPLLIVWGADDKLLPLATVGEKMHALDPQSELDVLPGCGHLAPALCSARAVKATVDFLRAEPVRRGGERTIAAEAK